MHNVFIMNRTHQHTHAGTQDVSTSNGCSSCSNNKEEREGQ